MKRLLLPMPGNEALAAHLSKALGAELGQVSTHRFPDGESLVRLHGDPQGRVVDIICTLAKPDPGFLSLLFAADCARELGARQVNLIAPYLAYMRQDTRFHAGEAVSSRSFARLVSSTFDALCTVDPHLHRHPTLASLYTLATTTLHSAPLLAQWIAGNVQAPLLVGPDEESQQWVADIAARIQAPFVVLRKTRHGDREVDIEVPDLSPWRQHTPVLVDDIASSGHTLAVAARKLAVQGLRQAECVVVHALLDDDAHARLSQVFSRFSSTDAVPHASNRIALAPLFAQALLQGQRDA